MCIRDRISIGPLGERRARTGVPVTLPKIRQLADCAFSKRTVVEAYTLLPSLFCAGSLNVVGSSIAMDSSPDAVSYTHLFPLR